MDLTDTIAPKSDQLNADDLLAGPRTVTISEVLAGDADQPVKIVLAEFGSSRPFKPSKSMRRVLVSAWGTRSERYVGHQMTLYRDPDIKFGGEVVGGIRISHMTGIERPLRILLTTTRGRRSAYTVQPLAPPGNDVRARADRAIEAFANIGVTEVELEERVGRARDSWTADDIAALIAWFQELQQSPEPQASGPDQ